MEVAMITTTSTSRQARPTVAADTRNRAARTSAYDVVIVGGGAAGLATAASLLRRRPSLKVAIIEPRDKHYYQPGWTLVGGGIFDRTATERPMASVMPAGVSWVRAAVAGFEPEWNRVVLEDRTRVGYRTLVVAPGLELHWAGIEGLPETLGRNGVTSNYLFEMAPYTWELVQRLRAGRALFTQPPMPIKCAGAPQKALYLSCDYWRRRGALPDIAVEFRTAAPVLFGVKEFVPPLMTYIERYGAALHLNAKLTAVDGPAKKAWFEVKGADGAVGTVVTDFDLLHVCPPQRAPGFVRAGPLADAAGWVEVDRKPCGTRAMATSSASGMPARRPAPRRRRRRASRPRWSPRTCLRCWMGEARAPCTTATARAR
jgi:sulfide:quinone oxidoreductase